MLLIDLFHTRPLSSPTPFWFMRQAGRYLPEYRAIRSKFPDFLKFCYSNEAACEVTLQPVERFGMSAAIIFSDILVIPDALGVPVRFEEKFGPVLGAVTDPEIYRQMGRHKFEVTLAPVYDAIRLTRRTLPNDKALIGFCGAAWTLACYMIQGSSSRDFHQARVFARKEPERYSKLLAILEQAIVEHACFQIQAGVDVIQLFDSWAGVLSEAEFEQSVIAPTARIVASIKVRYPQIPVIGFPRLSGAKIKDYVQKTGVDAVSFDGSVSLEYAASLQENVVIQGNLDPVLLAEDLGLALKQTEKLLDRFSNTGFIFNLSHGILPHTPIDHVQAVCDMIRQRT